MDLAKHLTEKHVHKSPIDVAHVHDAIEAMFAEEGDPHDAAVRRKVEVAVAEGICTLLNAAGVGVPGGYVPILLAELAVEGAIRGIAKKAKRKSKAGE